MRPEATAAGVVSELAGEGWGRGVRCGEGMEVGDAMCQPSASRPAAGLGDGLQELLSLTAERERGGQRSLQRGQRGTAGASWPLARCRYAAGT